MREIKFRAWDTVNEYMIHPPVYYMRMDGKVLFDNGGELYDQTDKLIVMQYTGLKDKNGNEIYEGDIVTDGHGNNGQVIWVDGLCQMLVDMGEGYDHQEEWNWCEIIGNIYENPELLD